MMHLTGSMSRILLILNVQLRYISNLLREHTLKYIMFSEYKGNCILLITTD